MKINTQTTLEMYLQIKVCKCVYLFKEQEFHYIDQGCERSCNHTTTFKKNINQLFPNRTKRFFKNEIRKN